MLLSRATHYMMVSASHITWFAKATLFMVTLSSNVRIHAGLYPGRDQRLSSIGVLRSYIDQDIIIIIRNKAGTITQVVLRYVMQVRKPVMHLHAYKVHCTMIFPGSRVLDFTGNLRARFSLGTDKSSKHNRHTVF